MGPLCGNFSEEIIFFSMEETLNEREKSRCVGWEGIYVNWRGE
jgi:hypothetical protein